MARNCSINDPEVLKSKIRRDVPVPKIKSTGGGLGSVVDAMPVDSCIHGITRNQAKSLCMAIRKAGFRPVERRLPDGVQYAVWKKEKRN
jgi:hypothetical protein